MSTQPEQQQEPCPLGPGETLSQRYSLELFIGEGTFGWVFSALDLSHALRRVAIKVLRPQYAARADMLRRLEERELALLLRIQELHPTPHVVRAREPTVQRHEDLSYLVLEFIDGPSLREVLDRGPLPEPERLRGLGVGLARGLAAIHAAGGVHRDLKPANIRLRGGDVPVIVDFGTALMLWAPRDLTTTGGAPMTPRYASPEQLAGRESTAASDVYAWGVILDEMLTGALPTATGERTPPVKAGGFSWREGHRELRDLVLRCLDPTPERRPTAGELVEVLSAPPVPLGPLPGLQRALGLLARFGVLVLLVLGSNHTIWPPPPPSPWSHRFGDAAAQPAVRMVRDAQGSLFLTGRFNGGMDLGAGPLASKGGEDLLVARLEPDATARWSEGFGDVGSQQARSLAVDPQGRLLVFGDFEETLTLGSQVHSSSRGSALFLARFDADGRPLGSRQWGHGDLMEAAALAVAADGTLTLLGNFTGSIDFGCPQPLVSKGLIDVFLVRLSPEGECVWNRSFGDENYQGAEAVTVDAEGNSAIWGYFVGTLDFGGNSLVNAGPGADGYLAVFDATGHLSWSKRLHIPGSEGAPPLPLIERDYPTWTVQFDPKGELVFVGDMALPASSPPGIHVARFDAHGQLLWKQRLGDSMSMDSAQVALTAGGGLLIAGSVRGTVDLGDGPFSGSEGPGSDLFVLELGKQREFLSARRFRGTAALSVWSVEEGPAGHPIIAGVFEGSLDLGSGLLSTAGDKDLFIAQLAPSARASLSPQTRLSSTSPRVERLVSAR